jgi:hypothetical protein
VVPAVHAQHALVVAGKLSGGLELPKAASACLEEVVMEQPLVVAPIPPHLVQFCEIGAAQLHVLQGLLLRLPCARRPGVAPRAHHLQALAQSMLQRGHQRAVAMTGAHLARSLASAARSKSATPWYSTTALMPGTRGYTRSVKRKQCARKQNGRPASEMKIVDITAFDIVKPGIEFQIQSTTPRDDGAVAELLSDMARNEGASNGYYPLCLSIMLP